MVSWCYMCRCNGEIVDHRLIHCSVAFDLWCYVIRTFGIWCVWRGFLIYYVDGGLGDLIVCQLFGTLFPCSLYNKLRRPQSIIFPWKGVWKVKAPWCVSFFVWTAVWDGILIGDNLRGRGLVLVDWCIMCRSNGETADHLLLHCGNAYQL